MHLAVAVQFFPDRVDAAKLLHRIEKAVVQLAWALRVLIEHVIGWVDAEEH